MNKYIYYSVAGALLASLWLALAQSTSTPAKDNLTSSYSDGLLAEEHDLDDAKAIEHYREVIKAYDKLRPTAAHAMFRLSECLKKLGRTDEAQAQQARLIREFPDFDRLAKFKGQRIVKGGNTIVVIDPQDDTANGADDELTGKLDAARGIVLGFIVYDGEPGELPTSLEEAIQSAQPHLPPSSLKSIKSFGSQFELAGANRLGNGDQILIKEKTPWKDKDGNYAKVYGYSDGHSQVVAHPTEDALKQYERDIIEKSAIKQGSPDQ